VVEPGPAAVGAEAPPAPVAGSGIVRRAPKPALTTSDEDDDYDISGYDLSRYDMPAEQNGTQPADDEPMRLAGADDPDAADEDEDDDVVGAGSGTRRRSRRGGARRRTRP
jgi:ribonuclease E